LADRLFTRGFAGGSVTTGGMTTGGTTTGGGVRIAPPAVADSVGLGARVGSGAAELFL